MSREDQYSINVVVDGEDFGIWDKLSGGSIDSEELKYKPGGMAPHVALGGSRNVENVTVSKLYTLGDMHPRIKTLLNKAGKGQVTITKQPLDVDKNPSGAPIVYTGTLKQVSPPDADSESNDAALVELEVSSNGTVA